MLFSNLVSVDMSMENVEGFKAEFVLHNIFNSSYELLLSPKSKLAQLIFHKVK